MKVFFDTSVIIAAILSPNSRSAELFKYIKSGKIIGITSQTAIEEVLSKSEKLNKSKSISILQKFIAESGLLIRESITLNEIMLYEGMIANEDAHLIAGANLTKCKYLVSLDKKHLLRSDIRIKFLPLKIVSPKELLEKIKGKRKDMPIWKLGELAVVLDNPKKLSPEDQTIYE